MKKITLLCGILCLFVVSSINAQMTSIPDVKFEEALIALNLDSGPTDGQVPTANISGVTSLDIRNSNISNLTGIEDFTALVTLNCLNNNLTSLDVSSNTLLQNLLFGRNQIQSIDLVNNVALTNLRCNSNQLQNLNVSANTALQILDCSSNQLQNLDVSANTALTILLVDSNQLQSLDVSANSNLTEFFCNDNQLTSLNFKNGNNTNIFVDSFDPTASLFNATNNPNLTCIQVDNVAYSTANWSDLVDNPSSFSEDCHFDDTYVPDDAFEQALINLGYDTGALDNYVPTANISGVTSLNLQNRSISDLTGIEDFVALSQLLCYNNQLSSLDLRANTALDILNCSSNQLSSLDVSANTVLTSLYCSGNQLSSLDVSANTNLFQFDCSNNQLSSLDVSDMPVLEFLDCYSNQLTVLNVKNGNNGLLSLNATGNSNLSCIQVDDVAYSTAVWSGLVDNPSSFSENCFSVLNTPSFDVLSVSLYPNPVNDILNIKLLDTDTLKSVTIYDVTGKEVQKSTTATVDMSTLRTGLYLVKITSDKGSLTKRVVKQ